jgi:ubiquinone/menaquinone biosynthesis C-methylase UbiE
VLELGAGTGANLPYYRFKNIEELVLTDITVRPALAEAAARHANSARVFVSEADAEDLPFRTQSFNTIVFTLVFCSVPEPRRGLAEVTRLLDPEGLVLFVEHVRPREPGTGALADIATPAWKKIAGGCHLNRNTLRLMEESGLEIARSSSDVGGVFVCGTARRRGAC